MGFTDRDVHSRISEELAWEPGLRNDDIAVGVREGVVTLSGFVDHYSDKIAAERSVGRVKGVKAIVDDLHVKLPDDAVRPDPDLARAVLDALEWNVAVPHERIRVTVDRGWITLAGQVNLAFQREAAERAVRYLHGVRGVFNQITLTPRTGSAEVKQRIKAALHRSIELEADRITVEVDGSKAILGGTVRSYPELKDALRAARNAPGITEVETRLGVADTLAAE